jgi:predicted Zn-dependent protease
MTASRLDTMRAMVAKSPTNALARFGLANELLKAGERAEARTHLEAYLASYDDEGNGWLRLGDVCRDLGDHEAARTAWRRGIDAADRFGHPGMREEIEARLDAP